ncbi:uncharacterized protein [Leptinotarsa decemlineata]|uniref:uncharacterized protein n=1 Tax=Leptinotarsa decemlineata TaxID=7539 RepID=UPI003D3088A8
MGEVPQISAKCDTIKVNSFFTKVSNPTLDNILQKFWTLEEVPDIKVISSEDRFCENYFIKTTTRYPDGKYVVSLPFKSTNLDFGNTRGIALRRFLSLEKRLSQDKKLCLSYSNVLSDYLQKGHLIKVPPPPVTELTDYFYIPHHAVIKHESSTTPLRVVFDASSHSANKSSLNDTLYVGPKLQNDLVKLLLRFRLHLYVFTCDIEKMYRMIWLAEEHRKFQRILWRFSPSEPIADYQLNTVTFGVASSPYLAIRTLHQLANDYLEYPLASEVLKHSIYIDDILDGHNSLKICSTMKNEIIELLRKGGFEARKWASNSPELLHDLPESYKQNIDVCLDLENNITKILGLRWNPIKDLFFYSITADQDKICTKRNILSELARIFDPLGFLTPVTFFAKLIIQRLWSMGLGWDDRPPIDVSNKWEMFKSELPKLREIKIPRQIITFGGKAYELVGFCDSSLKGYCGVVYVRTTFTNSEAKTYLVCSKSKVSPLKPVTIPRLELCAAVLLAKLMEFLLDTFKDEIRFENIFAFTDSSVALQWIKGSPHCWQTFVSNRVSFIQERLAPSLWYHISSELNPADGGSRGSESYLRQIFAKSARSESISWHFNPPYSPHMGGIWEANIESFKTHLKRIVGNQILTYEEFNTVIIQIESVMNSRPLCSISTDPNDLAVLTPAHFLTLEPLSALPDPDVSHLMINRLNRWQLLQRLHRDFWKRWRLEYLHTLQQRYKWTKPLETITPGTMVAIKNDNANPLDWLMGQVTELTLGTDRVPRVAIVKTTKGLIKRPLVKLCPLPDYDDYF